MTTLRERSDALRRVPLFSGVSESGLQRLARAASEMTCQAGTLLIEADSPAAGLFVIDEGRVVVEQRGRRRRELGPGEVVGEMALLRPDGLRTARVRAVTDVRCFALDRRTFQRVLVEEPRLALALLETLAERVAD